MELLELILLLLCAVLLSSVIERCLPKISIPLVQIALGIVIAIFSISATDVSLPPDLFLVLFIAPLLFYEAKISDKFGLWKNLGAILSLAVGLVVAIMAAVGFGLHWLAPSISIAAALALGAALGPTDAVAVTSLSETARIDRKTKARLQGECLLNDASGVVAFQFATAAAVYGTYTVGEVAVDFTVDFFGGLLLGLAIGFVYTQILKFVERQDLGMNVFYVLFEVCLPFLIYLMAEAVHVSGIIAVVAAGLLIGILKTGEIGPQQATVNIVSENVWKVISFALNGIVFVLLGMQIPKAMRYTWQSTEFGNATLIACIIAVTAMIIAVRFVWLICVDALDKDPGTGRRRGFCKKIIRPALVATIGGPKGAVTLSIIMSAPLLTSSGTAFPQRDVIIFIASGVIICTLVLANFALPLLAPAEEEVNDEEHQIIEQANVLRRVIERLNAERTPENKTAIDAVIMRYTKRLMKFLDKSDVEIEGTRELRLDVLRHEQSHVLRLIDEGKADPMPAYEYLHQLNRKVGYITHRQDGFWWLNYIRNHIFRFWRILRNYLKRIRENDSDGDNISSVTEIQIKSEIEAINYISRLMSDPGCPYPAEVLTSLMKHYQHGLQSLLTRAPSITNYVKTTDFVEDIQRKAYNYEMEEIQAAIASGRLNRNKGIEMRDSVYLMLVDLDASMD